MKKLRKTVLATLIFISIALLTACGSNGNQSSIVGNWYLRINESYARGVTGTAHRQYYGTYFTFSDDGTFELFYYQTSGENTRLNTISGEFRPSTDDERYIIRIGQQDCTVTLGTDDFTDRRHIMLGENCNFVGGPVIVGVYFDESE